MRDPHPRGLGPAPRAVAFAFPALLLCVALGVAAGHAVASRRITEDRRTAPPAYVASIGRGVGPYRLGMPFRTWPGLIRSTRGQSDGIERRTDYYHDIRLVWYYSGRLVDVVTTRPGDRTSLGFVIGKTSYQAVSKRYPTARREIRSAWGPPPVGSRGLSIIATASGDVVNGLTYWFDVRGALVGIEVFTT